MQLDSQGITTILPPGWEGRITRREAPAAAALGLTPSRVTVGPTGATGERTFPIAVAVQHPGAAAGDPRSGGLPDLLHRAEPGLLPVRRAGRLGQRAEARP